MKIIDRYFIREIISPFFLALFVFAAILLTDALIRSIEIFVTNKVSFILIVRFLLTSLPYILQVTIPMSFLTSVLIAFGRLSADSEIVALKANGLSLSRLSIPVFMLSILFWALTQYVTVFGIPKAGEYRRDIAYEIMESNVNIGIKPNIFNDAFQGLVIYCESLIPRTNEMKDLFIYREQAEGVTSFIFAKNGQKEIFSDKKKVVLSLEDGLMHEETPGANRSFSITTFHKKYFSIEIPTKDSGEIDISDEEYDIAFLLNEKSKYAKEIVKVSESIQKTRADVRQLKKSRSKSKSDEKPVKSIVQSIKKNKKEIEEEERYLQNLERRHNILTIVIQKKFAIPIACLVFPLVAIPLGIRSRAGGKSAGFFFSIVLILFYYIFLIGGEGLGRDGTIPPWLGIWMANIILFFIGLYLFYKVSTERPFKFLGWISWKISSMGRAVMKKLKGKKKVAVTEKDKNNRQTPFNVSFPHILDRYVGREFFRIFFLLCSIIISVTIIVEVITKIKIYLQYDALMSDFISYIALRVPFFVVLSIHIAVLIATILTITILSRNHELTAMKASGISLIRASLPIFVLAFVIAISVLFINERVVPRTNNVAEEIYNYKIKKKNKPSLFTQNKNWYRGSHNSIYSFSSFDQREGRNVLNDFLIYSFNDSFEPIRRIHANQVQWNEAEQKWYYIHGEETIFDSDNAIMEKSSFERLQSQLTEKVEEFSGEIKNSDKMNYSELRNYILSLSRKGIDTTVYETDLLAKLSMPLISCFIALFGIPFAISFQRSGALVGVSFSIFIGMFYYVIYRVGISLGHSGQLPPFLAAWGANIIFVCIGLYFLVRART